MSLNPKTSLALALTVAVSMAGIAKAACDPTASNYSVCIQQEQNNSRTMTTTTTTQVADPYSTSYSYSNANTYTTSNNNNNINSTSPSVQSGRVNVDVIDQDSIGYVDRIKDNLVNKPAPEVGMTRAAIEAIYGPPCAAIAPGKNVAVYTNEYDLVDGMIFKRNLSEKNIRAYEVSYATGLSPNATDRASAIELRQIPRVGDHVNMASLFLGKPAFMESNRIGYTVPLRQMKHFGSDLENPSTAVLYYTDKNGYIVGQEYFDKRTASDYQVSSSHFARVKN